jgi:hypothetical protein
VFGSGAEVDREARSTPPMPPTRFVATVNAWLPTLLPKVSAGL